MIAHIVLFEPKQDISSEQRRVFLEALRQTVSAVPQEKRARIGKIASMGQMPESGDGHLTYSYAAVLEFADKADLDSYLGHAAHDLFRLQFWELCQATLIVDCGMVDLDSGEAELLV